LRLLDSRDEQLTSDVSSVLTFYPLNMEDRLSSCTLINGHARSGITTPEHAWQFIKVQMFFSCKFDSESTADFSLPYIQNFFFSFDLMRGCSV
jgi:hypothetical protein